LRQFNLETTVKQLESKLEETINSYEEQIRQRFEESTLEQKRLRNQLSDMESRNNEADQFLAQQFKMKEEIANLTERLANEKALRLEQVNQKELDRIKETEQLRKEMLFNIKKTKANLLAMNDKQLQTTTHLTILQNHQLTTELEHQSKQTEILIYKNNKMKQQIETYQREIDIHKEVEKELAKRSHFCQKVIKRLKQELVEVTQGAVKAGSLQGVGGSASITPRNPKKVSKLMDLRTINGSVGLDADLVKGSEDLINFLEQKLEQQEKNLLGRKQEYDSLLQDYHNLQS